MTDTKIFSPLVLPNGTRLPNRIAKAAMEENIADIAHSTPSKQLIKLYDIWAQGGSGTIITGHVMVDRSAMAGPGDVALDQHSDLKPFREWANASKRHGAQVWMQINHPGRQMRADLGLQAYAPSAVSSVLRRLYQRLIIAFLADSLGYGRVISSLRPAQGNVG